MIKKLILVSALLSFGASAKVSEFDFCKSLENLAGTIMEKRQNGALMSDMINAVKGDELGTNLIIEAYSKHQYSTEKNKQAEIQKFKSRVFSACIVSEEAAK